MSGRFPTTARKISEYARVVVSVSVTSAQVTEMTARRINERHDITGYHRYAGEDVTQERQRR